MTRRTPLWSRGRVSGQFLSDPRRMCLGHEQEYFGETLEALAICQSLCVKCPVFEACTRYALFYAGEPGMTDGIWAGLTPHVRAKITREENPEPYYDWRREWNRKNYTRIRARARYRRERK